MAIPLDDDSIFGNQGTQDNWAYHSDRGFKTSGSPMCHLKTPLSLAEQKTTEIVRHPKKTTTKNKTVVAEMNSHVNKGHVFFHINRRHDLLGNKEKLRPRT